MDFLRRRRCRPFSLNERETNRRERDGRRNTNNRNKICPPPPKKIWTNKTVEGCQKKTESNQQRLLANPLTPSKRNSRSSKAFSNYIGKKFKIQWEIERNSVDWIQSTSRDQPTCTTRLERRRKRSVIKILKTTRIALHKKATRQSRCQKRKRSDANDSANSLV